MRRSTSAAREKDDEESPVALALVVQSAIARVRSGFAGIAISAPPLAEVLSLRPAEMSLPSSRTAMAPALDPLGPAPAAVQLMQVSSGSSLTTSALAPPAGAGTTMSFGREWPTAWRLCAGCAGALVGGGALRGAGGITATRTGT